MKTKNQVLITLGVVLLLMLSSSIQALSQTVYTTRTGEKYHADGCQYLSKSKIETTISDAKSNGYTACSVCKPGGATVVKQASASSVQCSGTTKSGARCKRKTTAANGRCYQH